MDNVPGIWRSMFSGPDNQSIDVARPLGVFAVFWYCFMGSWAIIVQHQNWDAVQQGGALAGVLLAVGGMVALKKGAEPKP